VIVVERAQISTGTVRVRAENVGGIDETEVEFRPGVNLLTGWNASNRTSLLQAVMAISGSDRVSLKGDADEGNVEMEIDGETYSRSIERRDGEIVFDGDPYADGSELADLFAFLLESNEARRTVARGDDLRDIIMRPVDTDAIQAEIDDLESRERDVASELDERGRLVDERDSLEEQRATLERRIEEKRADMRAKREEIDAVDAGFEETRERKAELESKLATLQDRRSALDDVRYRLETEQETADGIRDEFSEVAAELDQLAETPTAEIETIEERTETLRERKRALDSKINQLQSLIRFNEEVLEGDELGGLDVLGLGSGSTDDVTSRLLPEGESFVCWTCGEETTRADVEEMLETLQEGRADLVGERREVTAKLEEAKERKDELTERDRRRSDLERRRDDLEREREDAEDRIEDLEERRDELVGEIEALEAEIETLRDEEYDEVIDLHKEANALELEVEQLESDLDGTEERLGEIEDRLEDLADLEDEREEIRTALKEARTRIGRIEDEAIEEFNDHMAAILDALDYENVERIWLERVERDVREGRRSVSRGFFDLHVVRSTESGTVYEDTIEHLSESEREVTGLVFALAGYLVHDVHETIPFVLLDSIEAIDANRIATLIEYMEEYAEYLIVALLPEDADSVNDQYHRITEI